MQPAALLIQKQPPPPKPEHDPKMGQSGASLEGIRLAYNGILAAVDLMTRHVDETRVGYSAAIRLRLDMGTLHAQLRGALPDWSAIRRSVKSEDDRSYALRSCGAEHLGNIGTDNCFWSAPPVALADTVRRVHTRFRNLFSQQYSVARPLCHNQILRHQEVALLCAMRELGVANCAATDTHGCGLRLNRLPSLSEERWATWPVVASGFPPPMEEKVIGEAQT